MPRISRGSYDIHGVSEDMRPQEGRQALNRDQLDMSPEHGLEEVPECHKVLKRLLIGLELDEQIDVAVGARRVSTHRAEQGQPPDAQPEDLGLDRTEAGLDIGTGGCLGDHDSNLAPRVSDAAAGLKIGTPMLRYTAHPYTFCARSHPFSPEELAMSWKRLSFAGFALVLLPGCGAILHGSRQNISVQSSPAGASISTSPASGSFTTPTNLVLERKNSYVLNFSNPGYTTATFNIQNNISVGVVVADILLTGLVGVIVDAATGSWYNLTPESATVTLTRMGSGDGPETISVQISDAADGQGVAVKATSPVQVRVQVERK